VGGGGELPGGQDSSQIKGWWALGNVAMAFEGRQWWVILTVDFEGCADLLACSPLLYIWYFLCTPALSPSHMAPVGFSAPIKCFIAKIPTLHIVVAKITHHG